MNRASVTRRCISQLLIALILICPAILLAGPEQYQDSKDSKEAPPVESWCQTPPPWEVRISIPGWLAGVSGDSGVKGVVSSIDANFSDLFKKLTHVPLVGSVDLRYQRWELFGDAIYEELGDGVSLPGLFFTNANIHVKSTIAEGFIGYRLINCDKAALSLFAGARYSYMGLKININDNGDARLAILRELLGLPKSLQDEGSTDWFDPVLGARGRVKIWKATSLFAEGDVGGFDANGDPAFEVERQGRTLVKKPISSADWSYQVQGGLEFQLTRWIWLQTGWRYLKYDYVSGGFTNKTALSGPLIQGGVNF